MKKILFFLAVALSLSVGFETEASACWRRKDVVIVWEQLSADASLKQFLKATKNCQIENLNNLVARANEEFYKCKTIEDIYFLRDQIELIKFYNEQALQKSINVTNSVIALDRKIQDVEAKYKEESILHLGRGEFYRNRGQELNGGR